MEPPKKKGFFKWIVSAWPSIRLGLEAVSLIVLFFHLLPDQLEGQLKATCIGVFSILGIIAALALIHSIQVSSLLNSREEKNNNQIKEQNEVINEKTEQLTFLETQVNQLTSYKNVFILNNKTFASLREAHRANYLSADKTELKLALREFCNDVNEIFSNLKATNNIVLHVCIKIMTQPANKNFRPNQIIKTDKIKVKTLMRDGRGDGTRSKVDSSRIDHYVSENTDFLAIFEQASELQNRCFMCNDLMFDGYRNSSFKGFNKNKEPYHIKGTRWPLPYKASITAPISPGITPPDPNSGTLIGFLCIDSMEPNLFEHSDVEIVAGLADGLYDTLNYYINKYILKNT